MEQDAAVGLAGDARARDRANRQRRLTFTPRLAQRGQRVGSFAGLRDCGDDRVAVQRRVAVAELAGVLDLDGDAGKLLEEVFADEGGVVARAAGGEDEALGAA